MSQSQINNKHNDAHTSSLDPRTHKVVEVEEVVLRRPRERGAEFAGGSYGGLDLGKGEVEEGNLFCLGLGGWLMDCKDWLLPETRGVRNESMVYICMFTCLGGHAPRVERDEGRVAQPLEPLGRACCRREVRDDVEGVAVCM